MVPLLERTTSTVSTWSYTPWAVNVEGASIMGGYATSNAGSIQAATQGTLNLTSGLIDGGLSEENGGRRVKFEIDKANGTMVVTRTNMSNTFDGTVGTNYTYSYDPVTKTVTFAAEGYTSFTGITFDENGAPTYAAYFGVAYTNYTLQ